MMGLFESAWPWYVAGPLIAACMAALLFAGKRFGVSSNFQTLCTLAGAGRFSDFFRIDWRERKWNLVFILGTVLGGALSGLWLRPEPKVDLSSDTVATLESWGLQDPGATFEPMELYGPEVWGQPGTWLILLVGGFLVGFGTRWADGCTSGHAISGLSSLQLPSLIAVVGFFIGGLTMTHWVLPYLFH